MAYNWGGAIMNQNNQRITLFIKIAVVIILVGFLVGVFIKPAEIWRTVTGKFFHSGIQVDGLNECLERQYPNVVFSSSTFPRIISLVSPDLRWVVCYSEKSTMEFASIEDPFMRLTASQTNESLELVSWSPSGEFFVATKFTGSEIGLDKHISDTVILFQPNADGSLERYEFSLASVLKSGTPYVNTSTHPFAWSPDGKFLALMTHPASAILIVDAKANYVQSIPIQDKTKYPYVPTSDLFWTKRGLVYFFATSIDPRHYKLMLIDPQNPDQHIELIDLTGEFTPRMLGINGDDLLISETLKPPHKCRVILLNAQTLQEKSISEICFGSRSRDFPNSPYALLVSKDTDWYELYWIFNWETAEYKELLVDDYLTYTEWSPALDGIGVFRQKDGGDIELWVVKP